MTLTNEEWMKLVWESSKLPDSVSRDFTPIQSFAELLEIFPDAAPAAKRAARLRIKQLTEAMSGLSDLREVWSSIINKEDFRKQAGLIEYSNKQIEEKRDKIEKELKQCYFQLEYIRNLGKPQKQNVSQVTPERIARARTYPIADLVKVKRGTALCVFHDDHKPSMKLYPDNHVYCFSCAHRGDAIDVYMALNGCGFQDAVKALAP